MQVTATTMTSTATETRVESSVPTSTSARSSSGLGSTASSLAPAPLTEISARAPTFVNPYAALLTAIEAEGSTAASIRDAIVALSPDSRKAVMKEIWIEGGRKEGDPDWAGTFLKKDENVTSATVRNAAVRLFEALEPVVDEEDVFSIQSSSDTQETTASTATEGVASETSVTASTKTASATTTTSTRAPEGKGFFSKCCGCVASVCSAIVNCLKSLFSFLFPSKNTATSA